MEFYLWCPTFIGSPSLFQFPTGWNSTQISDETIRNNASFNSQRDGILRKAEYWEAKAEESFNSQRDGILLCREAYFALYRSFNSQRDGILPGSLTKKFKLGAVSIPNGMEFYPKGYLETTLDAKFQFPTGWNSTPQCGCMRIGIEVSIPNGMEFYRILCVISQCSFCCFNSQRDGILRGRLDKVCAWLKFVSIPNGMEFYTSLLCRGIVRECFNSQRDGILLKTGNTQ